MTTLRIACVQFEPLLGRVDANLAKIRALTARLNKEIDLLVLPELAVTGYNFKSGKEIEPFLEHSGKGASFQIAKELSAKFKCTTVIGYPEKCQSITYNSALVVDHSGRIVSNYRKTHLYETDEGWGCSESPTSAFPPVVLSWNKDRDCTLTTVANIGICMDLNPYRFTAPFNSFEFSMSCWKNGASLIIVPTAWLSSDSPSVKDDLPIEEKQKLAEHYEKLYRTNTVDCSAKPSQSLIDYWIARFFPFLSHPYNGLPKHRHKTTVVICNRTGIEDLVMYGGSSCILQFDPSTGESFAVDATNPSVQVLASAGRASDEVLYHEVSL